MINYLWKKAIFVGSISLLMFSLTACGKTSVVDEQTETRQEEKEETSVAVETDSAITEESNLESDYYADWNGDITMEQLLDMYNSDDWVDIAAGSTMEDWGKFDNLNDNSRYAEGSLTGAYTAELTYQGKVYNLEVYYWILEATECGKEPNAIDMIIVTEQSSSDGIALYRSDWDKEKNQSQDFKGFLGKEYDITTSITFEFPNSDKLNTEITLDSYKMEQFLSPFSGSLLLCGDYEVPEHGENAVEAWYSLGGIEECQEPEEDLFSYENGMMTDAHVIGNHMDYEKVASFQTDTFTGLLYQYDFDLFTAPEAADISDSTPTTSRYWVAFLGTGDGEPVYMAFLNSYYFTKEEALDFAESVSVAK